MLPIIMAKAMRANTPISAMTMQAVASGEPFGGCSGSSMVPPSKSFAFLSHVSRNRHCSFG